MTQSFKLPPQLSIPEQSDPQALIEKLSDRVIQAVSPTMEKRLEGFSKATKRRIALRSSEKEQTSFEWLMESLNAITMGYIDYRTGLNTCNDLIGRSLNSEGMGVLLTSLSKALGERTTAEIYRELTTQADAVISKEFGIAIEKS
ncbi:MAG: hypothetical protein ACN2B6_03110 [Rickettsiales bacterium]